MSKPVISSGELIWGSVWRTSLWGTILGTAFGGVYGIPAILFESMDWNGLGGGSALVTMPLVGIFAGAFLGGIAGLLSGIATGFFIPFATKIYGALCGNESRYRMFIGLTSALFAAASSWQIFYFFLDAGQTLAGAGSGYTPPSTSSVVLQVLIPALIAGACAGFVSQRIIKWYETEFGKE